MARMLGFSRCADQLAAGIETRDPQIKLDWSTICAASGGVIYRPVVAGEGSTGVLMPNKAFA